MGFTIDAWTGPQHYRVEAGQGNNEPINNHRQPYDANIARMLAKKVYQLDTLYGDTGHMPISIDNYIQYAEAVTEVWEDAGDHQQKVLAKLDLAIERMFKPGLITADMDKRVEIFILKESIMKLQGKQDYSLETELNNLIKNLKQNINNFGLYLTVLSLAEQIAKDKASQNKEESKKFITQKLLAIIDKLDKKLASKEIKAKKLLPNYYRLKAELLILAGQKQEAQDFIASASQKTATIDVTTMVLQPILKRLQKQKKDPAEARS